MRFWNISVSPGDHAPFLETHGNSVGLGRSAKGLEIGLDTFSNKRAEARLILFQFELDIYELGFRSL